MGCSYPIPSPEPCPYFIKLYNKIKRQTLKCESKIKKIKRLKTNQIILILMPAIGEIYHLIIIKIII
jgi:hypothetical protein